MVQDTVEDPAPKSVPLDRSPSTVVLVGESIWPSEPADPTEFDWELDPDGEFEFDAAVDPESETDAEFDCDGDPGVADAESAVVGGVTQPAVAPRLATATDAPATPSRKVRRFDVELPREDVWSSGVGGSSSSALLRERVIGDRPTRTVGTAVAYGSTGKIR